MQPKNPLDWMLSEALDSLTRAERLRQQFGRQDACWEPPIDVLETEHELLISWSRFPASIPTMSRLSSMTACSSSPASAPFRRSFATPASIGSNCRRGVLNAALHCPLAATPSAAS
ncbi:hypothetical protein ACVWZW_005606 [Bradyrhizobium sp. F1.13.4]